MAKGQQANLNATLSSSLYLSFSKNSFFWCSSGCSLKADAKVGIFLTPAKNWQRNLHVFNFRLHLTGVTSSKCVRTHYNINASQTNQATHTTTLPACAVHRCAAFVETNNKQLRHQAGTNIQKNGNQTLRACANFAYAGFAWASPCYGHPAGRPQGQTTLTYNDRHGPKTRRDAGIRSHGARCRPYSVAKRHITPRHTRPLASRNGI